MIKILVVNAGSSSLKYQLIDMKAENLLAKGLVERIGISGTKVKHQAGSVKTEYETDLKNHTEALKEVTKLLLKGVNNVPSVIKSTEEVTAVGHRVVHAAEEFTGSVLINDKNLAVLEGICDLAPLHQPPNIACIRAAVEVFPGKPQAAVFDTAFHSTIPQKAYMYAIKYEDYAEHRVRRYGFHGTSHKYVSEVALKLLKNPKAKIITCHLGNGSSVTAVDAGKSVDTSMGFTPLEGLIMGTRSGDTDPAVVEYLMEKKRMTAKQVINYLNKESGFLGICGMSDNRDIVKAAHPLIDNGIPSEDMAKGQKGDPRAALAFDMNAYRIKKYIGAYAAAMGGLDAIVFTGGIGENSWRNRRAVLDGMEFLGIKYNAYDENKNKQLPPGNQEITEKGSKVRVFVIPTNEELVIARETKALIQA